jgi:Effector-associated domain 7
MPEPSLKHILNQIFSGQVEGAKFSLEDLKAICFDLGVYPDTIEGTTTPTKGRELITHLDNRGRLDELAQLILHLRPKSTALLAAHIRPATQLANIASPDWSFAHIYGAHENFTGRADLTAWLTNDPDHRVLVLRALGGFGKSALAWHWLTHDLDPQRTPRLLWWSFYESAASFDDFLRSDAWNFAGAPLPSAPRERLTALLHTLSQPDTLLIFDGFERELHVCRGMSAAYQGDDTRPSPPTSCAPPPTTPPCAPSCCSPPA